MKRKIFAFALLSLSITGCADAVPESDFAVDNVTCEFDDVCRGELDGRAVAVIHESVLADRIEAGNWTDPLPSACVPPAWDDVTCVTTGPGSGRGCFGHLGEWAVHAFDPCEDAPAEALEIRGLSVRAYH
jgi:hypothetical protein